MKKYISIITLTASVLLFTACSFTIARNNPTIEEQIDVYTEAHLSSTSVKKTESSETNIVVFTSPVSEAHTETTTRMTTSSIQKTTRRETTAPTTKKAESASIFQSISRVLTTKATTKPIEKITLTTTVPTTKLSKTLPNYRPDRDAMELFRLVNQYRKDNGIQELEFDDTLAKLAYVRAKEQIEKEGHTRPDGTRFLTVFEEYGCSYNGAGENIAIGTEATPERMMNGWINSPSHNENMLRPYWGKGAIGLYTDENARDYFVLLVTS